ncbi:MAG: hypothetical protein ONB23_05255 [candidate division KSB1 bacterium]|nr:hypothetical protein [candidate division KSB1 bacterium]
MRSPTVRITPETAVERWRRSRPLPLRWVGPCKLRKVELIYLPMHLFSCPIRTTGEIRLLQVLVDAVIGESVSPLDSGVELGEERGCVPICAVTLGTEEARARASEFVRSLWTQSQMLGLASGERLACEFEETIAYPFWVLYVQRGTRYSLAAVDAVSGERTGPKLEKAVLAALIQAERAATR